MLDGVTYPNESLLVLADLKSPFLTKMQQRTEKCCHLQADVALLVQQ